MRDGKLTKFYSLACRHFGYFLDSRSPLISTIEHFPSPTLQNGGSGQTCTIYACSKPESTCAIPCHAVTKGPSDQKVFEKRMCLHRLWKLGYTKVQLRIASTFGYSLIANPVSPPPESSYQRAQAPDVLINFGHCTCHTVHVFMFCHRGLQGIFPARADSSRPSEFQDIFALGNMVSCSDVDKEKSPYWVKRNLSHGKIQLNLPGFCSRAYVFFFHDSAVIQSRLKLYVHWISLSWIYWTLWLFCMKVTLEITFF